MIDDLDRERVRRARILPTPDDPFRSGTPRKLGVVVTPNPPVGTFLKLNPAVISGAEVEGGPATITTDTGRTFLAVLLNGSTATGDKLVARSVDYRWVVQKGTTSSCNATLSGTLNGCNYQGFASPIPGIGYTATQGGTVVASGTTDGLGTIAAFTVHSTSPVTMTFSGLPARTGIVPYNVTPVCGSTVPCGASISLNGLGAYVCIAQRNYQPNYCLLPIATTLRLTSPISGAMVTLSYVPSSVLWAGSESYAIPGITCAGGVTPVIAWVYYPDAGQLQSSYRCGNGALIPLGSANTTQTCPTLGGGGYSAGGSYSDAYNPTATALITE